MRIFRPLGSTAHHAGHLQSVYRGQRNERTRMNIHLGTEVREMSGTHMNIHPRLGLGPTVPTL